MAIPKQSLDFSGVEETALLPLYAKAIESQNPNPIIRDEKAEALVPQLDIVLADRHTKMTEQLRSRNIEQRLITHLALRAKKYDEYAQNTLKKHPLGPIINIGCGFDTRFYRIDNGRAKFFDLDLQEMINFKRQLIEEGPRYHMIGQSVLDFSWMDKINHDGKPALFLFEGVLMYLHETDIKSLILELQKRFPRSELVYELTNRLWVEGLMGKMARLKMQKHVKMSGDAAFTFGVERPDAFVQWHDGIEFLEQWFYMDENHPKLGWERWFRNWKIFRNVRYTLRYRLNG